MKSLSIKNIYTRLFLTLALLCLIMPALSLSIMAGEAEAVTTANITITVTPGVIGISCNATSYAFGTVLAGATANTTVTQFAITNTSTVVTNHSIGVTGATWTGGATPWTHSGTATAGVDTIGMVSNRGGTWGAGDVIVKSTALNNIYANCPATTNYAFGVGILLPTSSTVNDQKTNVVQITVSAA